MKNNFKELQTSELENTNGGGGLSKSAKALYYGLGVASAYIVTHPVKIDTKSPRYSSNRLT